MSAATHVTGDDLVARARELGPMLAERAGKTEDEPDDTTRIG